MKRKTEDRKKDPNGTFRDEKITVSKMKNILTWINSRLDIAKKKNNIRKHDNRNYLKGNRKGKKPENKLNMASVACGTTLSI